MGFYKHPQSIGLCKLYEIKSRSLLKNQYRVLFSEQIQTYVNKTYVQGKEQGISVFCGIARKNSTCENGTCRHIGARCEVAHIILLH